MRSSSSRARASRRFITYWKGVIPTVAANARAKWAGLSAATFAIIVTSKSSARLLHVVAEAAKCVSRKAFARVANGDVHVRPPCEGVQGLAHHLVREHPTRRRVICQLVPESYDLAHKPRLAEGLLLPDLDAGAGVLCEVFDARLRDRDREDVRRCIGHIITGRIRRREEDHSGRHGQPARRAIEADLEQRRCTQHQMHRVLRHGRNHDGWRTRYVDEVHGPGVEGPVHLRHDAATHLRPRGVRTATIPVVKAAGLRHMTQRILCPPPCSSVKKRTALP